MATSDDAANHLVENLFARDHNPIPGISYGITYKLAQGRSGGDIVDVDHFDNDFVAFSVADIAGKGAVRRFMPRSLNSVCAHTRRRG